MILRRGLSIKATQTHASLASFIDYASATKLDRSSTVYRGTLYEYTVLETLASFAFKLYRTGGTDDKGIDLRGSWHLTHHDAKKTEAQDSSEKPLEVVIQCKNEAKRVGPRYIRELSGIKAPKGTLLILASSSTFTELAIQALMTSESPLCLAVISQVNIAGLIKSDASAGAGTLRQLIWNVAAAKVLGSLQVKVVHSNKAKAEGIEPEIRLLYDKKRLAKVKQ